MRNVRRRSCCGICCCHIRRKGLSFKQDASVDTLLFVWCKWQEVQHYRESGLPSRAPNSMNNYGLVLNEQHGCKQVAAGIERKQM